jgi:alpha-tubulin suppressor-like RCC1 family protein
MKRRSLATVAPLVLLVMAIGCGENTESPTAPQLEPALTAAATPALSFRQVSSGRGQTCGVTTDDLAYCWGYNASGELGIGSIGESSVAPLAVVGGRRFQSVSSGNGHTCAITTAGALFCWGNNFNGQLGDGTTTGRLRPTRVARGLRFRQVVAGDHHTCAVTTGDIAYCWGSNDYGQVGDATTTERWVPTKLAGARRFSKVSAGHLHSCGVTTDDLAYCWGFDGYGQLGDGSARLRRVRPTAVAGGLTFRQVNAGYFHTCGVTASHRAYCWGHNGPELGSVSGGTSDAQRTPRLVSGGLQFRAVTTSYYSTCGVTIGDRAYCWGDGALGNGSEGGSATPVPVSGGLQVRQVTTGYYNACAVTTDNAAYCWGGNSWGQLGDGTTEYRPTPVAVVGPM